MDGLTSDPVVSGYDWSYVGAFFRANYGYQGKYLAEFSCRYDGSSKFPENSKWGFFPSASIGWRLSEEKFMEWSRNWLDNFISSELSGTHLSAASCEYFSTAVEEWVLKAILQTGI